MTGVADRRHQPRVDRRVVGERLEAGAGRVDADVLEGRIERARGHQLQASLDAVAHAPQVAGVVEELLLDPRPDIGVGRRQAQPPPPPLLVRPHAQEPGAAGRLAAAGTAPRPALAVHDEVRRSVVRQGRRLVDRRDHHVVGARVLELGRVAHEAVGLPRVDVGPRVRAREEPEQRERMLLHPVSHGQPHDGPVGTDARAQQDRRRVDRAGAQHDALGPHFDPVVADTDPNADRAAGFDEHALDGGAPDDAQIRPLACRLQVRVVGRHARAVTGVEAERRDAGGRGRVVVLGPWMPDPQGSIRERVVGRPPRLARQALDRDRPVCPVVGPVAEVGVALHPPQVRKHVGIGPTGAPEGGPAIVVVGHRAEGHHPVHGRTAAEAPPSHMRPRILGPRAPRLESLATGTARTPTRPAPAIR